MTFAATAEVVRYLHAKPLLADCRADDLNLDVEDAARRIQAARAQGEDVAAIIPVHYGGQMGDMTGVVQLAADYGLKIVEDAAHCCPAAYRDDADTPWKQVGGDAQVSCFSFYANKTITTGEGGMACTASQALADRIRIMSLHGLSRDAWKRFRAEGSWYYEIVAPGYKYNLADTAAAIGLHQLRKADQLHAQRRRWAELYSELLAGVDEAILPRELPNRVHSWHLYCLRLDLQGLDLDRAGVIAELARAGIGSSVHWMPLHLHPYYRDTYGCQPNDCPCAAALYPQLISLPLYPDLIAEDVMHVCATLKDILARARSQTTVSMPAFSGAALASRL